MSQPSKSPTALERARALAPLIEEGAARAEAERTLPAQTVKALAEAGMLRFCLPEELGGEGLPFGDVIEVWEEISRADGSTGWTVMANGSGAAAAAAFLSDEAVAAVFPGGAEATVGGQFAPRGQGAAVDGGFRVTGSYNFGSGTGHAAYLSGGFIPMDDGVPRMGAYGLPDMRVAFVPRDQIEFTDGWHVMGLRGTGSYDYELRDAFIPEGFSFPLFGKEPLRGGDTFRAIFRLGMMPFTAAGHAAWALGVGRRALDEIKRVAQGTQRMGDPTVLAGRLTFQKGYIEAEAKLCAARLLVLDSFGAVLEASRSGDVPTPEARAMARAATNLATEAMLEAADFAHARAGTQAIRDGSVLERVFRDAHTGSQHAFIGEKVWTDSADLLLGNVEDSPIL